ncbi:glycosyltransferase family 29 protein [Microbacterium sp. AK031]|uniref:glycosyltransferase family 29 protein n=1 Tax=Microbacterium sp. AK031 TaxID=2723076 RepID=UPI0021697C70|nr:glycosyltransferase family 29 protein [Microbacterium sp. AK031]MCS3842116.1 hypothetical protein [Microbacterium sp. AK031]
MRTSEELLEGEDSAAAAAERTFYDSIRPLALTYASAEPVRRIAVVGNQPLAASAQRAATIDNADVVFRVNGFRVDDVDAPPAVGKRADIVVFNRGVRPTPWFFHEYGDRLYLMIEPGRLLFENPKLPEFWPRDLGCLTIPNREVVLPLGRAMGLDPRTGGQWATTGTVMLWIATRLFPDAHVDIAGFSFIDEPEQTAWNHAYGDSSPVGIEHVIELESRLVKSWVDSGRIEYHR